MSVIFSEKELPVEPTPPPAVEAAYAHELAETASKLPPRRRVKAGVCGNSCSCCKLLELMTLPLSEDRQLWGYEG
jgi:hypothetical protein